MQRTLFQGNQRRTLWLGNSAGRAHKLINAAEMNLPIQIFDHTFYQTPRFITEDIEITIVGQGRSKVPGQPVQWIFQVVCIKKQSEHSSHVRCQVRPSLSEFDKVNTILHIAWKLLIYIHVMRSRKTGRDYAE